MRTSFTRLSVIAPRALAIALLASASAVPQVQAQTKTPAPLRALEDAVEATTETVLLPTSQPGTLTFRDCAEPCKLRSVEVTSQSTFFVGRSQVTFAEFIAHLRRTGPQSLKVFRQPDRNSVTRLVVTGQLQ